MDLEVIREDLTKNVGWLEERQATEDLTFDYSDLGNSIGLSIGYLNEEEVKDLIEGIKHGLSLKNKNHW